MNKKNIFLYITSLIITLLIFLSLYSLKQISHHAPPLQEINEKPLVVIIPSFNNSQWYQKNLDSIFMQHYTNFRVIYIDDCSEDNTYELVKNYAATHPHTFNVQIIKNNARCGALANLYYAIHSCKDDEIIITVDGDDWLIHPDVFKMLNMIYQNPDIFLTYGQWASYCTARLGICRPLPDDVIQQNSYRNYPFVTSHLCTFYAGLFKKIKQEDLMYNGEFLKAAWDVAFMFPLLEMAAGRHHCITDIIYMYNDANPINDYKVRLALLQQNEYIVRTRKKYEKLPENYVFS